MSQKLKNMAASTFHMSLMALSNAQLSKGLEREFCEKRLVIELWPLHLELCIVACLQLLSCKWLYVFVPIPIFRTDGNNFINSGGALYIMFETHQKLQWQTLVT